MTVRILKGDCRDVLGTLPDASVQCVVTSPPYYGLRDYGTATWEGGDAGCGHVVPESLTPRKQTTSAGTFGIQYRDQCRKCGARRIDSQIGLEQTPDAYVAEMVAVFRDVRRVLRDDGTLWLNLGDSYGGQKGDSHGSKRTAGHEFGIANAVAKANGTLAKQLLGIPWRVAFALQADGWYLRQDIIWSKPNPMPESVRDRCTKAHEYVFLLSKSARYYYDADAIAEASAYPGDDRHKRTDTRKVIDPYCADAGSRARTGNPTGDTRNKRSVWTIATQPFSGAHFACMPPELAETCIKAGSSERGQCPHCGAPWQRQLNKEPMVLKRSDRVHALGRTRTSGTMVEPPRSETTGWAPTCGCPLHRPVPQTVLDPFGGAGTTALVADRIQRDAVIIELNPQYAALARERINGEAGMFAPVAAE